MENICAWLLMVSFKVEVKIRVLIFHNKILCMCCELQCNQPYDNFYQSASPTNHSNVCVISLVRANNSGFSNNSALFVFNPTKRLHDVRQLRTTVQKSIKNAVTILNQVELKLHYVGHKLPTHMEHTFTPGLLLSPCYLSLVLLCLLKFTIVCLRLYIC